MQMTEIRKESWSQTEKQSAAIVSIAAKAKELLGYDVLAKVIEKTPQVSAETELQAALKMLEISPLNKADVLAYQKERLVEQTAVNMQTWLKEIAEADELKWWRRFGGPSWTLVAIDKYRKPIPEFVIAKAIQIRELLLDCRIMIESLEDHPDPFLIVGVGGVHDERPAEHYYVEVWDEPKFEGRVIDSDEIPF